MKQALCERVHQNYFRDYDPAIGRYVESDPIGMRGGTNTYQYAKSSPLLFEDPSGLLTTGAWIRPPRINITNVGLDGFVGFVAPSWSWYGYIKFLRYRGHARGFINIEVRCNDDCHSWEIRNYPDVSVEGTFDLGPNLWAGVLGLLTRNGYVAAGTQVISGGLAALDAQKRMLTLLNQNAGPQLAAILALGPTGLCLSGTGR